MKLLLLMAAYLAASEKTVGDLLATAERMAMARSAASADLKLRLPVSGQRKYVELLESNKKLSGDAYHMGCSGGKILRRADPKLDTADIAKLSNRVFWMVIGLDSQGVPNQAISLDENSENALAKRFLRAAIQSKFSPCQYGPGDSFSGPIILVYEFDGEGKLLPTRKMIDLGIQRNLEMIVDADGKTVLTINRRLYN